MISINRVAPYSPVRMILPDTPTQPSRLRPQRAREMHRLVSDDSIHDYATADVTLTSELYSGRAKPMEGHGESDDATVEPTVRGR